MERLTLEQRLQDAMLSRLEAIPAHNPAPTLTSAQQFGAASASQIRGMDGVKQIVYEPFQLLAAIERKDLETLFRIRDHQFSLLVEPNQGVIPLVFAMRIGETRARVQADRSRTECMQTGTWPSSSRARYRAV